MKKREDFFSVKISFRAIASSNDDHALPTQRMSRKNCDYDPTREIVMLIVFPLEHPAIEELH